jgi:S-adenosylmethionine decarboxylase
VRVSTIGYHYVVEASGCDQAVIAAPSRVQAALQEAARRGRMDVKTSYFYRFSPTGVSGVLVLAESHMSVHTWPEEGYAAVDVYVCGEASEPEDAIDVLIEAFCARHAHVTEIKRGLRDEDVYTHTFLSWDQQPEAPGTGS